MEEKKHVDPTALGLFGLAIVTLVASMNKFGLVADTVYVLPWAMFLGASAQILAGFLDYKKGNAFGGLAFVGYGFFWFSVALTWAFSNNIIDVGSVGDKAALGYAYIGYLIFSIFLTVGSLKTNLNLVLIFIFIDLLFLGLSLYEFNVFHDFSRYLAASAELAIAVLSFYGFGANILNIQFGRTVLPIGKFK